MAQPQTASLQALTAAEHETLAGIARAGSERADRVASAKALLAVAQGARFTDAARAAGRRSGDGVAKLVARFNRDELAALDRRQGGGPPPMYGPTERAWILRELQRPPDREHDGTATWSLTTLQRALRRAPDGLPAVSTWMILQAVRAAGYTFQQHRTWCHTGTARRTRKDGTVVQTTDRHATPTKN